MNNRQQILDDVQWQKELDNLNTAIREDHGSSFAIDSRQLPKNVFRGGLLEYLVKHKNLLSIDTITLTGDQVKPGIFRSSVTWSPKNFSDFMKIIDEMKIKRLGLDGCELSPEIGEVIGQALKTNSSLEEILLTSNQLEKKGMLAIMKGLEENTTLKTFSSRSYNVECYYWSPQELNALKNLIIANKTLENIELPDNQISEPERIRILIEPYRTIKDRKLPTIKGFELSRSCHIPDFNQENAENGSLEKCASITFSNRYY